MGVLGSNLRIVSNDGPPTYLNKAVGAQIDGISANLDSLQVAGAYALDFETEGQVLGNVAASGTYLYTFGETDTLTLPPLSTAIALSEGLIYQIVVLADDFHFEILTDSGDNIRWDGADTPDGIHLLSSEYGNFIRLSSLAGGGIWEVFAVSGEWTRV